MICPKCKGEAIEIRGNYFCAKCGTKVNLESAEKEIKNEMASFKEASTKGTVDRGRMEEELNAQQNQDAPIETKKEETSKQELKEDIPEEAPKEEAQQKTGSTEVWKQSPEASATPSFSHNKSKDTTATSPDIAPPASSEAIKKGILHYDNIKTLLIVVIILNILIIAGLIYFFVIK